MKRKLPPFAAVRAFEAAARHQSFTSAAEELNLTQSAISHQVKRLEQFLDTPLFRRCGNGLTLTPRGVDYAGELGAILDRFAASSNRAAGDVDTDSLVVSATPAFASRWLVPRMDSFGRAYPEIEVRVATTTDPLHFPDDGTDVLIQYGDQPEENLEVEPFLSSARYPACNPDMLSRGGPIRDPDDLARATLLRDVVGDDWTTWFRCATGKVPATIHGPRFAHCELTLRAAEEGLGVVLAYGALIENEVAAGHLIRLFDVETPMKVIYSLSYRRSRANRPAIAAFRNWIFDEISEPLPGAASA